MKSGILAIAASACIVGACTYGNTSPEVTGVDPDGDAGDGHFTLGPFSPVPGVQLAHTEILHATVATAKSLYVIGGYASFDAQSAGDVGDVARSHIGADDSLSPFEIAGHLLAPRRDHAALVIGDFLYVIGGTSAGRADLQTSLERATIAADGSLGPFVELSGRLVHARVGHSAEVIGTFLYVVGGVSNELVPEVERAPILADHSLGPFEVVSGVTLERYGFTTHVLGSSLYVVGGYKVPGADLVTIDAAPITGTVLGAFTNVANVAVDRPRSGHMSVVAGDSLFVLGGRLEGSNSFGTVEQATFDGSSTLGALVPIDIPVIERAHQTATRVGRSVYVIGGDASATNTVERARLLDR